jgi:hypothetical protein
MEEEKMEYRGLPIPKITTKVDKSRYTPVTILMWDTIATLQSRKMLKVLFDSGSTRTLINRDCLPANAQAKALEESKTFKTLAGELKTTEDTDLMRNGAAGLTVADALKQRQKEKPTSDGGSAKSQNAND